MIHEALKNFGLLFYLIYRIRASEHTVYTELSVRVSEHKTLYRYILYALHDIKVYIKYAVHSITRLYSYHIFVHTHTLTVYNSASILLLVDAAMRVIYIIYYIYVTYILLSNRLIY